MQQFPGKKNTSAKLASCLALLVWMIALAATVQAVPYAGEETFTYRQPDGSSFPVKLYGDEFFAYQRTLDGHEVTLDAKTRFWCYARLSADGRSFLSTGIPVVTASSGSIATNKSRALASGATKPNATLPNDVVLTRVRASQGKHRVDEKGRPLAPGQPQAQPASLSKPAPPARTTLGTIVGLCILVDFPDQPGSISQTQVDNLCNQPTGYTEFGNACSVNEYFRIQSNGKFNFCNTVTAYVRMPKSKAYYDNDVEGEWGTATSQELVATALDILMAQGFDFTTLSRDSSGYIYSINVFYAGTCSSGWSLGLWPHSWAIPDKVVDAAHNIRAFYYQMSDMGNSLSIGTFCHENAHMTCLYPDLYSYVTGGSLIGYYSLMSSGSHGGGGKHPNSIDPYLKIKSGWSDVVEVNASTHLRATGQEDRNFFYKYKNPADSREYFLVENRNNTGYEGPFGGHQYSVAPGRGLVVWHVFEAGSNTYSSIQEFGNYITPYEAFVIEANPSMAYSPWYSAPDISPDSSDTFYSGQGANPLSDATSPELRFWDHNNNTGRTINSGMSIHTYDTQGAALSYTIGSGSPPATPAIGLTTSRVEATCVQGSNPASQIFNIFNANGGTLAYSINDNTAWLSCSPASGSVTTGSNAITVTFNASALTAGQHTATITVTAAGASNSPQTIPVTLTVVPAPVLSVTPATISEDLWPGQSSNTKYISISSLNGTLMHYTVSESASWLTPMVTEGTCSNETDLISFTINATGLAAGAYTAPVQIAAAGAANSPQTVNVTLTVHGGLVLLTPNGGEQWKVNTTQQITWASNIGTNVKIELLKGGALDRVIVASTANDGAYDWAVPADMQQVSDYRIRITTLDSAYFDTSDADFSLIAPIYSADMTTDPGWTLEGDWDWGQPTGAMGDYGSGDPSAGYTGSNVIGYNLNGDYPNSLYSTQWATTPAFDCSNHTGVTLSFYRWLGVEENLYDSACIEVSNDGMTWTRVWENDSSTIDDGGWQWCEYDISALADRQATVQVRWGMGDTDDSVTYCGWNIDDVLVTGTYAPLFSHAVNFQTDGTAGATLTGNTAQTVIQGNDCTPVTANAPLHYHFTNWTKDSVTYSTDNPLTVTNVAAAMTFIAHFAIDTYTLTYTAGTGGSISGTNPQTVNHGASGTAVTAVPASGYRFVQWSDGVTANPRTDTNVTMNMTVTASFILLPAITSQPAPLMVNPGAAAQFHVTATGDGSLTYLWSKDGVDLANGGRISGADAATLTITGAQQGDEGMYRCLVSNTGGSVTSDAAPLTVNDPPVITAQPQSQLVAPGDPVQFSVTAIGTPPLSYQWRKDGTDLTGKTEATLSITNAQDGDKGSYTCLVSNSVGSDESAPAVLTVKLGLWIESSAGSPTPATGLHYHAPGTQLTLSIPEATLVDTTGTTKRICTGWTAEGSAPASGATTSLTFTLDEPTTVTWQWKTQYKLTLACDPPSSGSLQLNNAAVPAESWQDAGSSLSLQATPVADCVLSGWSGDLAGRANPAAMVMDRPAAITARFTVRSATPQWWRYR